MLAGPAFALSFCVLVSRGWSYTVIVAVPVTIWILIILNGRIARYLQRGPFRRSTDGPQSALRVASFCINGLLVAIGLLFLLSTFTTFP
jgi:hypothetical protein